MQLAGAHARIDPMLVLARRWSRFDHAPLPSRLLPAGIATLAVVALVLWLLALGRPLLCPCGTVRLWAPAHDSQHLADYYSLLHLSFGIGLTATIARVQPDWPWSLKGLVVLLGGVAWEAIENIPAVIALFNPPAGSQSYDGDTILNALGDTLFVVCGCILATRLSPRAILLGVVAIEAAVWLAIEDGIAIGAVRLLVS